MRALKRTLTSLALSFLVAGAAFGQALRQVGVTELPGPKGQRFDYLTMDEEDRYLLSASDRTLA